MPDNQLLLFTSKKSPKHRAGAWVFIFGFVSINILLMSFRLKGFWVFLSFHEFSMMFPVASFPRNAVLYWEASGAMQSVLLSPELRSKQLITATVRGKSLPKFVLPGWALPRWQPADDACCRKGASH